MDEAAIEKRHRRAALRGVPFFRLGRRKVAKERALAAARQEALDERARREEAPRQLQRALDRQWQMLLRNDPQTVLATLEGVFSDNAAPAVPVDCQEGRVTVLMLIEGLEAVPDRVPTVTPTGRPSSRRLNKTERNELYLGGCPKHPGHSARSLRRGSRDLGCHRGGVGRRADDSVWGDASVGRTRGPCPGPGARAITWDRPEALDAILHTEELLIEVKGRTKEVSSIDLESHPDLARMVDQVRKTLVER